MWDSNTSPACALVISIYRLLTICGAAGDSCLHGGQSGQCLHGTDHRISHPLTSTVNVRSPLLHSIDLKTAGGASVINLELRSAGNISKLAESACSFLHSQNKSCNDGDQLKIKSMFDPIGSRFQGMSAGQRALSHIHMGWQNVKAKMLGEARLCFTHALNAFPSSRLLLREYAGAHAIFAQLASGGFGESGGTRGGITWTNGSWAYNKDPEPEGFSVLLETWESYASVQFQTTVRELHEEEADLIAAGVPASSFIPRNQLHGNFSGHNFTFVHRLRHDIELIKHLSSLGLLQSTVAQRGLAAYKGVLASVEKNGKRLERGTALFPTDLGWQSLYPFFNRRLYVHPSPRIPGQAVSTSGPAQVFASGVPVDALAGSHLANGGVLVWDNFLTPAALQALRDFTELSTIFLYEYESYLQASMTTGYATPLVAQIADELREALPDVLCNLELEHVWAFKYDDEVQQGNPVHADLRFAVNVNLWITPDEDNLDSGTGGLVIYEADVDPKVYGYADYNRAPDRHVPRLRSTGFRNVTVAYKQNRVVVWPSNRLHTTQAFKFRRGRIRSRRINITFLFGTAGQYCKLQRKL